MASADDWRASAFLLERQFPDEYGVSCADADEAEPPQVVYLSAPTTTVTWNDKLRLPQYALDYIASLQEKQA